MASSAAAASSDKPQAKDDSQQLQQQCELASSDKPQTTDDSAQLQQQCELAAREAAEAHLQRLPRAELEGYLHKAATAPNSALLFIFQDGPAVVSRHRRDAAASASDGDEELLRLKSPSAKATRTETAAGVAAATAVSSSSAPARSPDKVAYLPVAVIDEMLGREVPMFTYSKKRDIVVAVVLCGLDDAGRAAADGIYHATFVYPVITTASPERSPSAARCAVTKNDGL